MRDVARAVATAISPDLFVEKVKVSITRPAQTTTLELDDDLAALIEEAGYDETLAEMLAEDLEAFLVAAKTLLEPADETEHRAKAEESDWFSLLASANTALLSRLTKAG